MKPFNSPGASQRLYPLKNEEDDAEVRKFENPLDVDEVSLK